MTHSVLFYIISVRMKFRCGIQISLHFHCQKMHEKIRKVIWYIKSVDKENYTWWSFQIMIWMECDKQSGLHFLNMIYQDSLPMQKASMLLNHQREKQINPGFWILLHPILLNSLYNSHSWEDLNQIKFQCPEILHLCT